MGSYGQASLREIWEMLDACAPGWTCQEATHYYRIMWRGRTYPALSKGEHGKKQGQGYVEVGHIKQMIRQLEIDLECCKRHLDVLR